MENKIPPKTKHHRPGGIFPFLAVVLFFLTLISIFSTLSGHEKLERAWKKTETRLEKQESDFLFLFDCLKEGSLSFESESGKAVWSADLPENASFVLDGKKENLGYYLSGDCVTVESPKLLSKAQKASRKNGFSLNETVFSSTVLKREHRALALALSATADPFAFEASDLFERIDFVFKKACPKRSVEKNFDWEAQDLLCTKFTYTFDSASLVRFINAFAMECKNDEVKNAALSLAHLLRSAAANPMTSEERANLSAFLTGQSDAFNALSAKMGQSDSFATLSFLEKDGMIAGVEGKWDFGKIDGAFSLFLGTAKKGSARTLSISTKKDGKEVFSLSLSDCVTDDSDKAFIRDFSLTVSDQTALLLSTEQNEFSATIRYSWGREKGDLGLKIVLPDLEFNFRATLIEYKKGKGVKIELGRIEENGKNLLGGNKIKIALNENEKIEPAQSAEDGLVPKKDALDAKLASFEENYLALFGEAQ